MRSADRLGALFQVLVNSLKHGVLIRRRCVQTKRSASGHQSLTGREYIAGGKVDLHQPRRIVFCHRVKSPNDIGGNRSEINQPSNSGDSDGFVRRVEW
ncbi:MAG: hypothetical protein M2R45_00116 [Verrucomicrobia subdivision 3 bacterium]|nr:hypothetical protein [Limisphaerales bacterium]MCS1412424.1 hypothetical protein [Limisphaerales bacterium]